MLDVVPGGHILSLVDQHANLTVMDAGGIYLSVNRNFCDRTGYSEQELIGASAKKFRPPCHDPAFYEQIWNRLDNNDQWRGRLCKQDRHGDLFWEDIQITPITCPDSGQKNIVSISYDITFTVLSEKILEACNLLLKRSSDAENLPKIFDEFAFNLEACFPELHCSIMLLENEIHLRSTSGPSLPEDYKAIIDGVTIGENVGSCGAAAALQQPVIIDDLQNHPNWAPFAEIVKPTGYRSCWSYPLISSNQKTLGTFAIYCRQNRLPSKEQEHFIKLCSEACKQAIEADQNRRDLEREKQLSDSANKAKSEFLANMSHELRTPLNAIIGFSSIMSNQLFGEIRQEKYRNYIKDIEYSATFLLSLINDILDISVIEAGKLTPEAARVSSNEIIESCLRLTTHKAKEKGLKLVWPCYERDQTLYADPQHLKQVIINLLNNAIKFTKSGGEIRVFCDHSREDMIAFHIQDNGVGIAGKDIEKILLPFEQSQNTLTRNHDGVGLGLALSKRLVEAQGGKLTIQSELYKGTTVTITVPTYHNNSVARSSGSAV
ncbi:sensor histidine kinase [Kiloniella sp. b19]|uniref:sensor histidine kinase n=1 Tax=Kiloniella sp. GXU_MW_B19 TaxID=3141326 RepID=UPI0031DB5FD3